MIKVGDLVRFYNVKTLPEFIEVIVSGRYENGIPSCRKPMLTLDGYDGVVLESHCKTVHYYNGDAEVSKEWGE